jgi:ubiquinone/menaquinone biosynthesis C-methylase UbiE
MSTTATAGSAARWGPLWGVRAEDWAATEEQQRPTYEEAIRRVGIAPGQRVLDVGCGSGVFLRLAADRGAEVHGLDASEALLEIARRRVPEADLRLGEMQALPYADDLFDLVAGFNSFFFADEMVAALREAVRVAKPGAPVVIQVWGRPDRCDLDVMKHAVMPFLPPSEPKTRRGSELWEPGVLEEIAAAAGLKPESSFNCSWAYEYADEPALLRGMLAAGGFALIAEAAGENRVEAAIVEALASRRTPSGGYRLENEWHYLVATAY